MNFDKDQLVRAMGWTGLSKLIGQVASFSTTVLLVRLLDKDDFGLFAMAVFYTWIIDSITDFGFQSAIIQRKDIDEDSLSSCFWLLFGVSLVVLTLTQYLAPWIAAAFAEERLTSIVRQLSWVFLVIPFVVVSSGVLSRELHLDTLAKVELGASLLRCTISIALAMAGTGVLCLVYGYLAERLLLGVALTFAAGWTPRLRFVYDSVKSLVGFGLNIMMGRLLWLAYNKMDTFVIGRLLGAETLGGYSVASQIAMALPQFISAVYLRTLFPLFSKSQDSEHLDEMVVKSGVYLALISLPLTLGMAIVASDLVPIVLGDKWQDTVLVVQVLSIVAAVQILSGVLPQAINALGRADISVWVNLVSLLVFGSGFYYGALWHGLVGVLIVWLVLSPLRFVVNIVCVCSLLKLSMLVYLKRHGGSFVAALGMVMIVWMFKEATDSWTHVARLLSCVLIGALAYGGLSLVVNRQPCQEFFMMLRSQRGRRV